MWEEGVRIYGTPGVYNNFPHSYEKREYTFIVLPKYSIIFQTDIYQSLLSTYTHINS